MRAAVTLYVYELRSHLSKLAVAFAVIASLVPIHRMIEGRWSYWSGEWAVGGLIIGIAVMTPLLVLLMTATGWASERSQGVLGWFYSHPVPATGLFLIRLLGVVTAALGWIAMVLLLHLPAAPVREAVQAPAGSVPYVQPGFWLLLIVLTIAAGMLASALAGSSLRSLSGLVACCLIVIIGAAFLYVSFEHLIAAAISRITFAGVVLVVWISVACLVAAWAAMRRAPLDSNRLRRSLIAGGLFLCPGMIVAGTMVAHAFRIDRDQLLMLGSLGESAVIKLCRAPGLDHRLGLPVVVDASGKEHVGRYLTRGFETHPGRGMAVFHGLKRTRNQWLWLIADRQGRVREIDPPAEIAAPANRPRWDLVGWSPDGLHLAWISGRQLIVMDQSDRFTLRQLPAGPRPWHGRWADNQHLILATRQQSNVQVAQRSWTVVRLDGTVVRAPESFDEDTLFYPKVRLGSDPEQVIGWRREPGQWTLVATGAGGDWQLADIASFTRRPVATSLGSVDGTLMWLAHDPENRDELGIMRLAPGATEAEEIARIAATVEPDRGPETVQFFLESTGRWIIWVGYQKALACHADSGAIRDLGNPGGDLAAPWQVLAVEPDAVITDQGRIPLL
jgi:hypothetical protein